MRTVIFVVTFVILLLVGFLATPGLFKIVNPEYLLALRELGAPLNKLTQNAIDTESQIAILRSKIFGMERSLRDIANAATAKQSAMAIANAAPSYIAAAGISFADKANGISSEKEQLAEEIKVLEERKTNLEAARNQLVKKLDGSAVDSLNIYLVARALALGAIGALMSILAKYLSTPTPRPLFDDATSLGRMWASMTMGAIVSVVVIGLFFTGFISIFANSTHSSGETDFWKVTILCLLAGAFSDRLFQAAAARMESYLRTGETTEPKRDPHPA
jgi:hypothetical protein